MIDNDYNIDNTQSLRIQNDPLATTMRSVATLFSHSDYTAQFLTLETGVDRSIDR